MKTPYQKALAGEWITDADIAKMVRQALKKAFPSTKFSVRTKHAISVSWSDGPTHREVKQVVKVYETKNFDPMIDMSFRSSLWLYEDGSASFAHTSGTVDSMGTVQEVIGSAQHPSGVLVDNISAVYISCYREQSEQPVNA
jgi:hypothetical protein